MKKLTSTNLDDITSEIHSGEWWGVALQKDVSSSVIQQHLYFGKGKTSTVKAVTRLWDTENSLVLEQRVAEISYQEFFPHMEADIKFRGYMMYQHTYYILSILQNGGCSRQTVFWDEKDIPALYKKEVLDGEQCVANSPRSPRRERRKASPIIFFDESRYLSEPVEVKKRPQDIVREQMLTRKRKSEW